MDRNGGKPESLEEVSILLPVVCLAWADGTLTPDEIGNLNHLLNKADDLTEADRKYLIDRLDPNSPPSAEERERWLELIRSASNTWDENSTSDIASFCLSFAQSQTGELTTEQRDSLATTIGKIRQAVDVDLDDTLDALLGPSGWSMRQTHEGETRTTLDARRLGEFLDGPFSAHKNTLRVYLQSDEFFRMDEGSMTEYRKQVTSWLLSLANRGYGGLAFPESVGGKNDIGAFISTFETLAYFDLSLTVKYGVQFGLFGGSIQQLGTEKHHQAYLADIASMKLPGCFAMTELGHGSNVRNVETTATYDAERDGFVVDTPTLMSRKEWIGNAAVDGVLATVFAQLIIAQKEYGVHAFVVPIRSKSGASLEGVRVEDCGHKMGLNGVDNGRISFDSVFVGRDALLDRFATVAAGGNYSSPIDSAGKRFFTMLGTLVGGRISVGLGALSACKSGLAIAVRYGNRRKQFGPKDKPEVFLLDYLTHQRKLLPALATTFALDFGLSELRDAFVQSTSEDSNEVIETLAAGLKAYSTRHTTDTLQIAREACGGQGYSSGNRLAALKADTDVFTTFEGDNTVLLLQVAKSRLSAYKRQFEDLNFLEIVRFLGEQATSRYTGGNPIAARKTDRQHLRSSWFHRSAFGYRAERLQKTVADRLKGRIDDGMDPFDAFVECQDHLVVMAEAFIEDSLVRTFRKRLRMMEDPASLEVMTLIYQLFALSTMESNAGWYLEQGYISGNKSKAIRDEVNALCNTVRLHAEQLVDAFLIPDKLLSAPIAFSGTPA